MKLEQKKHIVEELHEKLLKAKIVINTDYKGLNVSSITALRKQLRDNDIEYQVIKNTLLTKASEGTNVKGIQDSFKGPSAIAISYEDPVVPAKILTKFSEQEPKLEIKIGIIDGRVLDIESIKALAKLPSREILLSQLLGTLNNIPGGFVRTLNAIPVNFMNVLQAIKDQKESKE